MSKSGFSNKMLLSRYSFGKESYLSCRKRSQSSISLSKLSYHTTKVQTLKPLTDYTPPTQKSNQDEPIDDIGDIKRSVILKRTINFFTPAASAVLKIEPTL